MKVVILAGGLGTRLAEETKNIPKPMVEVGGKPILHHIMHHYSMHGFNEFILALGYKSEVIKNYFLNFYAMNNDLTVDLRNGDVQVHGNSAVPWQVQMIDTGLNTQTGGRIRRLKPYLDETFLMTYGDGVSDVDLESLVQFHQSAKKLATVTAVRPPSRFGSLRVEGKRVAAFKEKPHAGEGWINGGFFALEPEVLDYIDGDDIPLEAGPLDRLAIEGQLAAFQHEGFWHPMDTVRDRQVLEDLWQSNNAPWARRAACQPFGIAA